MSLLESINSIEHIINLENKHFINGTVILNDKFYIATNLKTNETEKFIINLKPNEKLIYKLSENIFFNPNINKQKLFLDQGIPLKEQFVSSGGYYDDMAYGIGFFTALSLTGEDYTLDLNNKTLQQSYQHYLRQRFFSLIELANSPFVPKTGPHNFTNKIMSAKYVTIKNGLLGLSSHHGIHGNNNVNITIENIHFRDFEVAAISLNGSSFIKMNNLNISQNNCNVPVLGIWSTGLFLYPYIKHLSEKQKFLTLKVNNKINTTKDIFREFIYVFEKTFKELLRYKYTKNPLFNNVKKLVEGPVYGILLNKFNVAINDFPLTNDETNHNHKLTNIVIRNLKGINNETPALINNFSGEELDKSNIYLTRNIQNDVVGSILQTQNYYLNNKGEQIPLTINNNGIYTGNIISNTQIIIAKAIHEKISFGYLPININTIQQETVNWVENNLRLKDTNLYYIFQGDSMHHVIKGIIALRLDTIRNTELQNITIENIKNLTNTEITLYNDLIGVNENDIKDEFLKVYLNYKNKLKPSHNKAVYAENQKSFVRGISMANTTNNILNNINIRFLYSVFKKKIIYIDFHDRIQSIEGTNVLQKINIQK